MQFGLNFNMQVIINAVMAISSYNQISNNNNFCILCPLRICTFDMNKSTFIENTHMYIDWILFIADVCFQWLK